MNWKERLSEEYGSFKFALQIDKRSHDALINYISTEIIEKLIEEIPNDAGPFDMTTSELRTLKQQLRDKWL